MQKAISIVLDFCEAPPLLAILSAEPEINNCNAWSNCVEYSI